MNSFLIRLFLVVALLCNILGSGMGVRAQVHSNNRANDEEQIRQSDGWVKQVAEEPQGPIESVLRSASSSHRVASSRPTRLLPTHGGKPGQHHWVASGLFNLFKYAHLQLCRDFDCRRVVAAPPRLYYVIALRRLLC